MKILENVELKPYTSMFVGGPARYFVEVNTESEIVEAISFAKKKNLRIFILGGGSNILVSDNGFDGLVIKVLILGTSLVKETEEFADIEAGAGENWDDFVRLTVEKNLYGLENMSHIPGNVGASVVQNIGCYGQEVLETVLSVKLININTLEKVIFENKEMSFSYRKSRLNDVGLDKGKYVVTSVTFRLNKYGNLNMKYGDIQKYFSEHPNIRPDLQTVRDAIISIRDNKFPYPDNPRRGSCGSFWNADVVDKATYEKIILKLREKGFQDKAEEMEKKKSVFTVAQGFKVVPGLFVEILGFKGRPHGGAKILETHAGIINNYSGQATAQDVFELSQEVIEIVYKEFGVKLKIEPELVGDF